VKFLVLGAGRLGYATVYDLVRSPKVEKVVVADVDLPRVEKIAARFADKQVIPVELDVTNQEEVAQLMHEVDVAISCVSGGHNYELSKIALSTKTHFVDLGSNPESLARQFMLDELAKEQEVTIVPGLGLAPGLVSLLAVSAADSLDELYEIKLRVGALPCEPDELFLGYSQVQPVDELLARYSENCAVVRDGKIITVPALSEVESIEFPKPFGVMEAFNISGVATNLHTLYAGRCQHIDYKAIRYSGHCQHLEMLKSLGMMSADKVELGAGSVVPRHLLAQLLKGKWQEGEPDVVILRVIVTGVKDKKPVQIIWDCVDLADQASGLSALMRMTAFPASVVAQMIARGDISERGVLRQEVSVPTKLFLAELDGRGINIKMTERAPVHK
jgi:lysine 6-dehydrogenase